MLSGFALFSRQMPANDSSSIQITTIPESVINAYKKNPIYDYEKVIPKEKSFMERVMDWLWERYDQLMRTKYGLLTRNIFFIIIGLSVILFIIYKIFRGDSSPVFEAHKKRKNTFSLETEELHQINFDEAIQTALSEGNYSRCIRLLYLKSLKILSEKQLINFQINKTNTTYLRELEKPSIQLPFEALTQYFERAYYGNEFCEKKDFDQMNEKFIKLKEQI
mgnify:CR=1 FL=1